MRTVWCEGCERTFAAAPEVAACVFCGREALCDVALTRMRGTCPTGKAQTDFTGSSVAAVRAEVARHRCPSCGIGLVLRELGPADPPLPPDGPCDLPARQDEMGDRLLRDALGIGGS